jgi:hypothetical protein
VTSRIYAISQIFLTMLSVCDTVKLGYKHMVGSGPDMLIKEFCLYRKKCLDSLFWVANQQL